MPAGASLAKKKDLKTKEKAVSEKALSDEDSENLHHGEWLEDLEADGVNDE